MHCDEIDDEFKKIARKLLDKGELDIIFDAIPYNVKLDIIEDCKEETRGIPGLLTEENYFKLAVDIRLGYEHRAAYIRFMLKGFPKERSVDYATEWAKRFLAGTHWGCADKKRKAILREAYGVDKI